MGGPQPPKERFPLWYDWNAFFFHVFPEKLLKIKGDAHEVGGGNQVNIAFSIPTSSNAQRPVGQVNVAAAVGSDKYELLQRVLKNLDTDIGTLLDHGVCVNGTCWRVEVLLTSDWKFLGNHFIAHLQHLSGKHQQSIHHKQTTNSHSSRQKGCIRKTLLPLVCGRQGHRGDGDGHHAHLVLPC
jgi:hypothetical protein